MDTTISDHYNWAGFFSISFLAVVFLQSGFDKAFNYTREMGWVRQKFTRSPLHDYVSTMFVILTIFELGSGLLSAVGTFMMLAGMGNVVAHAGAWTACLTMLMLVFGQRMTRDYTGAASLVPYFIVTLLSLYFLGN
jgi:polyferredoxin